MTIRTVELAGVELVADGLQFPEGPIARPDGSLLVVEMHRGTLSRIEPGGAVEPVAHCGGAPNGAAIGPDGAAYVCNNGGRGPDCEGGRIERVDLDSGQVDVLYAECGGRPLNGPNDLVFDHDGGLWFTDTGKFRDHDRDIGRLCYARPDGSKIVEVFPQLDAPNGIGLSPDDATLYWAETLSARLFRRAIVGPGRVEYDTDHDPATLVCGLPGMQMFDSLAVDGDGNVCVGTLLSACITVVAADGSAVTQYALPPAFHDPMPTNLCFGGPDLRTAYLTLSETGRVVSCEWPSPGLALAF